MRPIDTWLIAWGILLAICWLSGCDAVPSGLLSCERRLLVETDTCGPLPELEACLDSVPNELPEAHVWCRSGGRNVTAHAQFRRRAGCSAVAYTAQVIAPSVTGGEVACTQKAVLWW